jgi:hypothetical protein
VATPMGEIQDWIWHQRESERYRRLHERSSDPGVKARLAEIALFHARIASGFKTVANGISRRAERLGAEPAARLSSAYKLQLVASGGAVLSLSIEMDTDRDALHLAWALRDACADVGVDFELSRGGRPIAKAVTGGALSDQTATGRSPSRCRSGSFRLRRPYSAARRQLARVEGCWKSRNGC